MNWLGNLLVLFFIVTLNILFVECTELTFELEDNARQCFYEDVKKDTKVTIEFQVSHGKYLNTAIL